MAKNTIKTLNNAVPSIKRPVRVSDLQDIWDALASVFLPRNFGKTAIVAGMQVGEDNKTLSAGIIYDHGELFAYDPSSDEPIEIGGYINFKKVDTDTRTFSDGTARPFAQLNRAYGSAASGAINLTAAAYYNYRAAGALGFKLQGKSIDTGAITASNLANNAVTATKLAPASVQPQHYGYGTPCVIADSGEAPIEVASAQTLSLHDIVSYNATAGVFEARILDASGASAKVKITISVAQSTDAIRQDNGKVPSMVIIPVMYSTSVPPTVVITSAGLGSVVYQDFGHTGISNTAISKGLMLITLSNVSVADEQWCITSVADTPAGDTF